MPVLRRDRAFGFQLVHTMRCDDSALQVMLTADAPIQHLPRSRLAHSARLFSADDPSPARSKCNTENCLHLVSLLSCNGCIRS